MIAALAFGPPSRHHDGRLLRAPVFALRSTLPLSAACLVANGTREELGRLLAVEFDVALIEPTIPSTEVRHVLFAGAFVLRSRARHRDAFVVVRPADARRLVARAFGDAERTEGPFSEIEAATLQRIVVALAGLCVPLAGTPSAIVREPAERAAGECTTYFEVRTCGDHPIAIGFGLTQDPPEAVSGHLVLADLHDVELEGAVEVARGTIGVPAFSRLGQGGTLRLETRLGDHGVLRFGGVPFAEGICGTRGTHNALTIASARGETAA